MNNNMLTESQIEQQINDSILNVLNEDYGDYQGDFYNHTMRDAQSKSAFLSSILDQVKYDIIEDKNFQKTSHIIKELEDLKSKLSAERNSGYRDMKRGLTDKADYGKGDFHLQNLAAGLSSVIQLLKQNKYKQAYDWLDDMNKQNKLQDH